MCRRFRDLQNQSFVDDDMRRLSAFSALTCITKDYSTMSPFTADSRYIITGADSGYLHTPPSDAFSGCGRKDSKGNTSDPMMRSSPSNGQRHDRYDRHDTHPPNTVRLLGPINGCPPTQLFFDLPIGGHPPSAARSPLALAIIFSCPSFSSRAHHF